MKNLDHKAMDKLREYSSYPTQSLASNSALSSQNHINLTVARLHHAANEFATLPIAERIVLAESIQLDFVRVAEKSVQASPARGSHPASGQQTGL